VAGCLLIMPRASWRTFMFEWQHGLQGMELLS
jgi:hypothetical protein